MQNQNPEHVRPKPNWAPNASYLLITAIVFSIINISNGDPGIMFVCGAYAGCMVYADKLSKFLTLSRKTKIVILAAISIPGTFFMQQLESPSYALFFGGFKLFLNTTLGTILPTSGPFFDMIVAFLQFIFVMYMIIKGLKAFRERDNDEEWIGIMKVPVISLITLSVFDFVLNLVIAA